MIQLILIVIKIQSIIKLFQHRETKKIILKIY